MTPRRRARSGLRFLRHVSTASCELRKGGAFRRRQGCAVARTYIRVLKSARPVWNVVIGSPRGGGYADKAMGRPLLIVGDIQGDAERLELALAPYPEDEVDTVFLGDFFQGG